MLRHILCSFHPLAAILSQPSSRAEQPSPSLLPALSPSWLRQPEAGLHQRRRQMGNKAKICKVCNAFKFRNMAVDERFCVCCGCTNPNGCCDHPVGKNKCRNPIFRRGATYCSACRATNKLHHAQVLRNGSSVQSKGGGASGSGGEGDGRGGSGDKLHGQAPVQVFAVIDDVGPPSVFYIPSAQNAAKTQPLPA